MVLRKALKLTAVLRVPKWRQALWRHRVAAAVEHTSTLQPLCNHNTIVDIGANRGQFALAARHFCPEARIFSFEPLPQPAAHFRAVFFGDANVTLQEVAIGPQPGSATMHVSGRDDSSSLLPITGEQSRMFPGTAETGRAAVRVGLLRDFLTEDRLTPPALLKLDVQGYELEALRGCDSLLHKFAHVYVECSFVELYAGQALADEVIAWLRERGFVIAGIQNLILDRRGRSIQGDFLFQRRLDTPPPTGRSA